MRASEILKQSAHRSFAFPKRPWRFYQEWNKALFLHWQVDRMALEPFIPDGLALDTLNGQSWISMVAFDMNNIGVRSLPKLPHISDFYEINIRTYVLCKGKPSVYFLSMEGSKRSSCKVLKVLSKFPYQHAIMERTDYSYHSHNAAAKNSFDMTYRINSEPMTKDATDRWLTERYAVFQNHGNRLIEYDVHHLEWPIQSIDIKELKIDYPKLNHLIKGAPNRTHYSQGVNVLTWDKRKHSV